MNTYDTPFNHTIFVTNRHLPVRPFLSQIDRICQLQPRAIVLREKDLSVEDYFSLAKSVLARCARRNVPCILHSFLPALEALGAGAAVGMPGSDENSGNRDTGGISIETECGDRKTAGREDCCIQNTTCERITPAGIHLPLFQLRELAEKGQQIPDNFLTGCSVHSPEEAAEAERLGAAYLFAGHVYATDCKKGLPPRGLGFLREVCESVSIPVYAIGGMRIEGIFPDCRPDPVQKREITDCGAAGMAVMSGCMRL
ncbi:MAG: thiamine phosphate synthase [Eubacterium sp.]